MFTVNHFMDVGSDDNQRPVTPSKSLSDCPYCFDEFSTVEELRSHKRAHHVNKYYVCKLCSASFMSLQGWQYHYKGHNSDLQHSCDSCDMKFKSFQQYVLHLENHKFYCSSCEQTFARREQLRLHERRIHNILDGDYSTKIFDEHRCPKCNEKFRLHSQLREHRKKNAQCSPFPCQKCGRGFLSQVHLESHTAHFINCRKVAEKRALKKKFIPTSDMTPVIYIPRFDYSRVYVEPSSSSSFVCNNCELEFPKQQLRREHWIRHKDCRPYGCSHCSARFVNKADLETHLKCHLPKCLQCLKRFLNRHDFENHCCKSTKKATSNKNKNFKCLYCETNFTEEQLQRHIDFVSEHLYICKKCLDTFSNECTFGYHMMIDHGLDKEDV